MNVASVVKKFLFFWNTMERCDWTKEGDDDAVLAPVLDYLAGQDDQQIFQFDDQMSQLLYDLDTKALADACRKADPLMSDDSFLYSRCVALINGPVYYEKVRNGKEKSLWQMEFEALLFLPRRAWAKKHRRDEDEYPHLPPLSFETGSNREGWR
ncbi:MAG: DUF4240 domain-containing protein [Angelakisella sp.]|nr:DUF4240 domain-containing protein [Angelakisella sp.]